MKHVPAVARLAVSGLLLVCVPNGSAAAQTPTASIVGTITDETGGVLAGVRVGVVNEATGATRLTTTDDHGDYAVPLLPPGQYRVEAELANFRKVTREGIRLEVNRRALVELTLPLGAVAESVVVVADVAPTEGESAGIGTVVDHTKIVELPLNGRDFFQLTTLVPGAVPQVEGSQNAAAGGAVSVNGVREQSNNFLLDGIDNNDQALNQVVVQPPADAVQEFKVQASTYSAEFGRSGGAQFNYVTRSGANAWDGVAYGFFRNAALDARNFFDDPDAEIPRFQRSVFGVAGGGPLLRDRLFVFANYEGQRVRQAQTRLATVPPVAWRNGDFSSLLTGRVNPATGFDTGQLVDPRTGQPIPGNVIPPELLDAAGAAIMSFYPVADDVGARGPTTARVAPIAITDVDQLTAKIDHNVSAAHQLSYRYSSWNHDRFNPFDPLSDPTNVPGFGSINDDRGQHMAFGWIGALGPQVVNELRVGGNRLRAGYFQEHQGTDVAARIGVSGLSTDPRVVGRPGVSVGITDALMEPLNLPQERRDVTWHLVDALSWQAGRHTFKSGVDVRRVSMDFFLDIMARGNFTFVGLSGNPLADLLLGVPFVALRQNPSASTDSEIRTFAVSGYLQDDWRITPDLTLNWGMRYDYNAPPVERQDRFSVPDFTSSTGRFIPVGTDGVPRAGYPSDRNNVAPRIGAAWKPRHDEALVVRGGYGVYYDTGILNLNALPRLNPPQYALELFVGPRPLRAAFAGGALPLTQAVGIDRDFRDAYYHHFSAGLQRALGADLLVEAAYVASRGRNLPLFLDTNQGPAGGPPVRNPDFGPARIASSVGRSQYDSLQLRLDRRFRDGVSLLAAYTWSRSRDHASALFGSKASNGVPQNSFDLEAEWGPSDFDTPHRFVASGIWEVRGWTVAGIMTLQSGRPFTVYYGASANFSGTSNGANGGPGRDRPNQIGDPQPRSPRPEAWFDPAAFAPPTAAFGTVGRNTLRGDGLANLDAALYRTFGLPRSSVQLRLELFNVFNTPYFYLPIADLTSAKAGTMTRAADSRQLQLGLKLRF